MPVLCVCVANPSAKLSGARHQTAHVASFLVRDRGTYTCDSKLLIHAAVDQVPARRQSCFLRCGIVGTGHGEEVTKLLRGRTVGDEVEVHLSNAHEEAASQNHCDGVLSASYVAVVVVAGIGLREHRLSVRSDLYGRRLANRMDLDQRAAVPNQPAGLFQGMDRALGLHSAEGPG